MELNGRRVPPEQLLYARWLEWGAHLGLALLATAFLAYLLGVTTPHVLVADLPRLWALPAERYLAATAAPSGWGWLALAAKGDYLNLVGIALLGLVSLVCYLRLFAALAARGERLYALIAAAQAVVLLGAALY